MPCIDALEITVQMSKLTEELPNTAGMKKQALVKALELSVDSEKLKEFGFTHYRVIAAGAKSETLKIEDGKIDGFPTLKVRLYAYPDMNQVTAKAFGDDRAKIGECFSYRVNVPESSDCYFEDQNGYTDIGRVTGEMKSPEWFAEKLMAKCVPL